MDSDDPDLEAFKSNLCRTLCRKDQANYLVQSISCSKATDWNCQSVEYLHELVQQYGGRKSEGGEAEFQERI